MKQETAGSNISSDSQIVWWLWIAAPVHDLELEGLTISSWLMKIEVSISITG